MILDPGTPADPDEPISKLLVREEGYVPHAYPDSKGFLTIGIGTLIDQRRGGGITRPEAFLLMGNRLETFKAGMDAYISWWRDLDPVRRDILLAMAYQMGLGVPGGADGLMGFRNTLNAFRNGAWASAAAGIRASKWAERDSPERAERAAKSVETGVLVL